MRENEAYLVPNGTREICRSMHHPLTLQGQKPSINLVGVSKLEPQKVRRNPNPGPCLGSFSFNKRYNNNSAYPLLIPPSRNAFAEPFSHLRQPERNVNGRQVDQIIFLVHGELFCLICSQLAFGPA
jgi:hypothetical protein